MEDESQPIIAARFSTEVKKEAYLTRLTGADSGIVILYLDRPATKNALGKELIKQFREALTELQFDSSARVVMVASKVPGAFCSGADLKERVGMSSAEVAAFVFGLRSAFTQLQNLPQPTIACIDGVAFGGGLELALSCDLRIAGQDAKLGLTETALAIIPGAGGTQRLSRLIGASKTKELIFTAKRLSAPDALAYGLVNYVAASAYDRALDLARDIVPNGPIALRAAKRAIDLGLQGDLASGMVVEEMCYAQIIPTKDRLEGLDAFKEKRKPVYKGE